MLSQRKRLQSVTARDLSFTAGPRVLQLLRLSWEATTASFECLTSGPLLRVHLHKAGDCRGWIVRMQIVQGFRLCAREEEGARRQAARVPEGGLRDRQLLRELDNILERVQYEEHYAPQGVRRT